MGNADNFLFVFLEAGQLRAQEFRTECVGSNHSNGLFIKQIIAATKTSKEEGNVVGREKERTFIAMNRKIVFVI